MKQYISYKSHMTDGRDSVTELCRLNNFAGTEVYFDDIVPRDEILFSNEEEKNELKKKFSGFGVRRAHASYWAWPTAFLTKRNYSELVERMGGEENVTGYFGDLTGEKMYSRWVSEYAFCCEQNLDAYTYHLIDYAPIDGKWAFTLSRTDVLEAMAEMLSAFMDRLEKAGLLSSSSPLIELENAGWGLEYGAQTADDFAYVLSKVSDKYRRLRVAFDINHLLHALGRDENGIRFFLPQDEITPEMQKLQETAENLPVAWLNANINSEKLKGRMGSVHLSDRRLPDIEYFVRGKLCEPFFSELSGLKSDGEQEEYGVKIVLGEYDSHRVLGTGCLNSELSAVIKEAVSDNEGFAVLHELKNSEDIFADAKAQCAVFSEYLK